MGAISTSISQACRNIFGAHLHCSHGWIHSVPSSLMVFGARCRVIEFRATLPALLNLGGVMIATMGTP